MSATDRQVDLEQAVKIAIQGNNETWGKRAATALTLAQEFLDFLDPPPEQFVQERAKRASA